jgi:ribosomal-protein-serine acetyltransferase
MLAHPLSQDLHLVLVEPRHAEPLYRAVDENRAYLRRWLPWVDDTRSVADILAFIRSTQQQFGRNDGFQTVLVFRGEIAGMCGYKHIDWTSRSTELGYWLGERFQHRGLMTLACRAYLAHAFEALELNRVGIRAAVANERSRAIPERLGFTYEGAIRQAEWLYDRFVDHAVYGILREEWLTATAR